MIEQRNQVRRNNLRIAVKLFFFALLLLIFYAFTDYTFNSVGPDVRQHYRFDLPEMQIDQPAILRQKNLAIVVIKRSDAIMHQLKLPSSVLLDAASENSKQPVYAENWHRSRQPQYFVALAIGTDYGCPLIPETSYLRESCSDAKYDFSGRALKASRRYQNLPVPEYRFADDGRSVTITLQ